LFSATIGAEERIGPRSELEPSEGPVVGFGVGVSVSAFSAVFVARMGLGVAVWGTAIVVVVRSVTPLTTVVVTTGRKGAQ
jgi:hypothetical protein